jgi:hypothetical protein
VGWGGLETSGALVPTVHEELLPFREAVGKGNTIAFSGAWNKVFVLMRIEDED